MDQRNTSWESLSLVWPFTMEILDNALPVDLTSGVPSCSREGELRPSNNAPRRARRANDGMSLLEEKGKPEGGRDIFGSMVYKLCNVEFLYKTAMRPVLRTCS